ncbi:YbaN family protein [Vibrio sp. WXL103]|uniref:YbaN family protein n=1 Tax=unclassified Vibrio TaxID=2614977 RepID=UPI003EC68FAC
MNKLKQWLWNFAGSVCLILGALGVFLPLLPTTPFILLASACFMRGSQRVHDWMHRHPTFGPIIRNWHTHRGVSRRVKQRGAILIVISFCFSIIVVPKLWLKVMLIAMMSILLSWFLRLPVIESVADNQENN